MGFLISAEEVIARAIAQAIDPPPPPDITRWCEENIVFDARSPMPGPFDINRFAFLREIHEVLSPEHADIVAGTGWSKAQVQQYLYEHANRPIDGMQQIGKFREEEHGRGARAPPASHQVHRGLNSEDILVTVGGGDAGGHSAFIPSWSRSRGSIMQSKPIGVCLDCD